MEKRRRKIKRFTRDVAVVAGVVALLVIGTVTYFATQVQRDISEQYIHDATARAAQEFRSMQESVESSLIQVRDYCESGLISLTRPDEIKRQLQPVFGTRTLLSGICIADAQGRSYFIQPDGTERKPAEAGDFDARTRPWYAPALKNQGEIYWTEQYLFHTLRQVGVTASVAFNPSKEKDPLVAAVDVLLPNLYRKIREMAPSQNSDFFIFRHNELLFLPEQKESSSGFVPMESVTNALVGIAHDQWEKGRGTNGEIFSFSSQGKVWWCGFQPLEDAHQNIWMGVMVPESDIVGDVGRRRSLLLLFGLIFVLISASGAVWRSRRYARMLGDVRTIAETTEEDVLELIAKGENRYIEFKSTLRMNLHSKKPGKEIELAWLKGIAAFLNTDGGTLLLGVTDDGEVTGLERDVFENNDKCRLHFKNLVATHIGAEMSKYIRFRIVSVAGKTVGVVYCARSPEPVFLKNGNKEAFYIRNGPSSDELPVSKALKYIKNRK
jgi:hypothetical protein